MRNLYDRDHIRFAVFTLICLLGAAPRASASGLTITVNSTAQQRQPPGVGCTITEAIELTGLRASVMEPGVQVVGLGEPALGNCTVQFDAAADGMTIVVPAGEYLLTAPHPGTDAGFPLIGPFSYPFYGVPWGVRIVGDAAGGTIIKRDPDPNTPKFRFFHVQTWLKLEHLTLSGGDAGTGVGGAIFGDDSHIVCLLGENGPCRLPIALRHVTFENNTAVTGGALGSIERMYLEGVEFRIEDSSFRGNHAKRGGAISVPQTGWASIARSRFEENVAEDIGGAIDSDTSTPIEIADTTFLANRAVNQSGGAISARFARITRGILRDNSASGGGALFSAGGRPVVIDTAFTTNSAKNGGAIQIQVGSVEVRGSTFDRNVATEGDAGGLHLQADAVSSRLSNSTFSGNTATGRGGAAFVYSGKLAINNVTITGNKSGNNGPGLALRLWSESTVEIANSIVAGNSTTLGEFIDVFVGPAEHLTSFGYNIIGSDRDTQGWSRGPGDLSGTEAAPLDAGLLPLVDNGGPTFTHALSEISPARDGGSTAAPGSEGACETTDQRGQARPGAGSARCDSGAFENAELVQTGTATTLTSSPNPSVDGQSVRFTATIVASDPGAGIPGGSVQFLSVTAGTTIDLVALDNTGVANVDVPLAFGSHEIQALYAGDSTFAGSESTITQVVTRLENAAPVNTVPGSQSINQGTTLIFTAANRIGVADEDDSDNAILGDETLQVTLSAGDGSLTLSSVAGLNFSGGGNGTRSMTFTGSLTDINGALNGLIYMPSAGFSGVDSLTISTDDLGNFGAGTALTDTDTVQITVATVLQTLTINAGVGGRVVDAEKGIDCTGSCSVALPSGTTVTLSAQPSAPGAVFMSWGGTCQGVGACVVVVDAARTVTATFGYPVSVGASTGLALFSISPADSVTGPANCIGGCTWTVPAGTRVSVLAVAILPLRFVRWLNPNPCAVAENSRCEFTVTRPLAFTAKLLNLQGAPIARITGPKTLETLGENPVTALFDGSASFDPNGNGNAGLTYQWSIDGQAVATPFLPHLLYASLSAGSHLISLTVTDVEGLTGTETKSVAVTLPIPFPILHLPESLVLEATNGFHAELPAGTVTATNNYGGAIGFSCWTGQNLFGRFMSLTLGVNTVRCEASVPWLPRPRTTNGSFTVTVTAPLALSKAQALRANVQQITGATNAMKNTASKLVTAIETARPNAVCPALNNFVDAVTRARQQNRITADVMVGFIAQAADFALVAACEP